MSENKVFTYVPYNGAVYEGIGAERMDVSSHESHAKLGRMQLNASTKKYEINYGRNARNYLAKMAEARHAGRSFVGAIGDNSIDHINAFPLLRELIGKPAEMYFLEDMTRTINVPSLDARIPERDAFKAQLEVHPLEEVDFTQVKYGEDNFNLKYNATPFFHPTEDRMRGIIDPMNIDMEESRRALKEARNVITLFALTGLTDTNALGTPDWSIRDAGGRNIADPKRQIQGAIQAHWVANQSRIDKVAINPVDYQRYRANDNVKGFQPGLDVENAGIVGMHGIPGLTAYLDPMVPLGRLYFVDSQALLKGVGPLQTEQWREPKNNSDLGIVRDYVQVLLVNPSRYGFKSDIDVNTTDGDTAGTEPTSLAEAKAIIGNPQVAVNPPTISGA